MTRRHRRCRVAAAIAAMTVFMMFGSPVLQDVAANAAQAQPSAGTRSVFDGVYTEEQAKRGQARYRRCILCHLDELQGDPARQAPPIAGEAFLEKWSSHTVKELFETISMTMPQDSPGSLSPQEYADVLSYMLQANKFPGGKEELSSHNEQLDRILIEKPRPDAKNQGFRAVPGRYALFPGGTIEAMYASMISGRTYPDDLFVASASSKEAAKRALGASAKGE